MPKEFSWIEAEQLLAMGFALEYRLSGAFHREHQWSPLDGPVTEHMSDFDFRIAESRLQRERDIFQAERDHARAGIDRIVKLLTGIYSLMYPAPTNTADDRVMVFRPKSPDPHEVLQELSDRIRALPDELEATVDCESMNEQKAREILGDRIHEDRLLRGTWHHAHGHLYVSWFNGEPVVRVDGDATVDQLEAIAWWMRNKA